jgi:2-C-methyl-D-erythritol 4-phosphate cytidylyltransferase
VTYAAVLVAAGRGTRMGGQQPKAFLPLAGRPLFTYSLRTLASLPSLDELILVVSPGWESEAERIVASETIRVPVQVAPGGAERQDSVGAGLARITRPEIVIVHDAARPFASRELFAACIEAARASGGAIAALPAHDTIKVAGADDTIRQTIDRSTIWMAQTPQVFRTDILLRALEAARVEGFLGTDEAALVERLGVPVRLVRGEATNRKLTTPDDLAWAEWHVSKV